MSKDNKAFNRNDNNRVAAGQDHEVDYFAKKHGLTHDEVLELIKVVGNKRADLEEAIAKKRTA